MEPTPRKKNRVKVNNDRFVDRLPDELATATTPTTPTAPTAPTTPTTPTTTTAAAAAAAAAARPASATAPATAAAAAAAAATTSTAPTAPTAAAPTVPAAAAAAAARDVGVGVDGVADAPSAVLSVLQRQVGESDAPHAQLELRQSGPPAPTGEPVLLFCYTYGPPFPDAGVVTHPASGSWPTRAPPPPPPYSRVVCSLGGHDPLGS